MLNGDPKSIARLDKLIHSTQSAKLQSLRAEYEGLISPKGPGRKKRKLKWRSEDDCADNLRNWFENKHSGNLLKCILANDERQTVILRKEESKKYSVFALSRVKTEKL